jgi:hypothetical protein
MPQLSLYIDAITLKKIEIAAKIEHLSISKFVVKKLNESLHDSWPDNFDSLFGSINDDTFSLIDQMNYNDDSQRENL